MGDRLGLLRPLALRDGPRRHLAVSLLDELARDRDVDVARDHQHGVVRRIEAAIERQCVVEGELLDFRAPADHGTAIRVIEVERGLHLLAQQGRRVVGDPLVLLLQHNVEFRLHHRLGQHEVGHAVGFQRHQARQAVAGDALTEARVVERREGVLLPAEARDGLREFIARMCLRALEHQMFEEMRDT